MRTFLQQTYYIVIGMMINTMLYFLAVIARWIIAGLFIGIHIRYGHPTIFHSIPMFIAIVIVSYDLFINVPQLCLLITFELENTCDYQKRCVRTDVKVASCVVYVISAVLLGIILFK